MRINRQIRVPKVRLIGPDGAQVGVVDLSEAIRQAEQHSLDLVEIGPQSDPPVCKIIDYGKYRYNQAKKEKESKKAQHQIKVKEVKVKPNTDEHDLNFKIRHARDFLMKGHKVKVSCLYRGRELAHPEVGVRVIERIAESLSDCAQVESPVKMLGRQAIAILAPMGKKTPKKEG